MTDAPKKGRLTLYEDLLSDETRAELKAKEVAAQAEEGKKKTDASLMFKPTNLGKKNNVSKPANKSKPTFASMHKLSSSTSTTISAPPTMYASSLEAQQIASTPQAPPASVQQPSQKRGFSDWLANEDEEWMYGNKPTNQGRYKKKKKTTKQKQEEWSWEDIYDPHTPVSFLDYPNSEVQYDINEAWKQRLYDARRREKQRSGRDIKRDVPQGPPTSMQSAPSVSMSFAPPTDFESRSPRPSSTTGVDSQSDSQPTTTPDDPYATRMPPDNSHVTKMQLDQPGLPRASANTPLPSSHASPPLPASSAAQNGDAAEKAAKIAAQIAAMKAKALSAKPGAAAVPQPSSTPPVIDTPPPPPPPPDELSPAASQPGVISAAPTFNPQYAAWKARQESGEVQNEAVEPAEDPDAPRSNRPGQKGFAERMLKKMGWEEGKGLGAAGEGITTAIVMKAEKRKKKSDAEGGGYVQPANMGKIVGGKKAKLAEGEESDNSFASMSEVVKLEDILANLDVDKEIQDNNLLQEIGDEVGQFGKVERLFIWRDSAGGHNEVFVKFTSQLSALRAVKDMDGIEFAGNMVKAKFWDAEKFESGEYE